MSQDKKHIEQSWFKWLSLQRREDVKLLSFIIGSAAAASSFLLAAWLAFGSNM